MKLKIKKINHPGVTAKLPTKATAGSAGLDLYAAIQAPVTINPKGLVSIPTGIAVGFPDSQCAGFLFARSGLATRHGITLSNSVGVIDSDYTGEIIVGLCNLSDKPYTIEPGERFAQLVIMQTAKVDIELDENLEDTARNDAGFGSTGRF
jgi:dUTP pyrophosphatase